MKHFMGVLLLLTATLALVGLPDPVPVWASTITNPASQNGHTVDGQFTGFDDGWSSSDEWYDITPHRLQWSTVYFDYDGDYVHIMNDWTVNEDGLGDGLDPNDYNYFSFTSGDNLWELYIYVDSLELYDNGTPVSSPDDIDGAYHFGSSPNLSADHTMWEVAIDIAEPGTNSYEIDWNAYYNMVVVIQDPHMENALPQTDPAATGGFGVNVEEGGGLTSTSIPEPGTLALMGLGLAAAGMIGHGRRRR